VVGEKLLIKGVPTALRNSFFKNNSLQKPISFKIFSYLYSKIESKGG
jgi:hypothetical protein